jgi:hypothetical protein
MTASPLGDELSADIEADKITSKMDQKERNRLLSEKHSWDKKMPSRFGPSDLKLQDPIF